MSSIKASAMDDGDASPQDGKEQPATVSALKRGLDVLLCIEAAGGSLSLQDVARRTGLSKATALRLIATLVASGFLRRSRTSGNYLLGPAVIGLSRVFLSQMDLRSTARPLLAALAERLGGMTVLALRNSANMVVIETGVPQTAVTVARVGVGWSASVVDSCMGHAYLAALSVSEREAALAQIKQQQPDRWVDPHVGVGRALKEIGRDGFCMQLGQTMPGINGAACALMSPDGEVLAVGSFAPAATYGEEFLHEEVGPQLVQLARQIASQIGGAAPRRPTATTLEFVLPSDKRIK